MSREFSDEPTPGGPGAAAAAAAAAFADDDDDDCQLLAPPPAAAGKAHRLEHALPCWRVGDCVHRRPVPFDGDDLPRVLVLDVSGSMKKRLSLIKESVRAFVRTAAAQGWPVLIVLYDHRVSVLNHARTTAAFVYEPGTHNHAPLPNDVTNEGWLRPRPITEDKTEWVIAAIENRVKAGGATFMAQACRFVFGAVTPALGRSRVFLMTDGSEGPARHICPGENVPLRIAGYLEGAGDTVVSVLGLGAEADMRFMADLVVRLRGTLSFAPRDDQLGEALAVLLSDATALPRVWVDDELAPATMVLEVPAEATVEVDSQDGSWERVAVTHEAQMSVEDQQFEAGASVLSTLVALLKEAPNADTIAAAVDAAMPLLDRVDAAGPGTMFLRNAVSFAMQTRTAIETGHFSADDFKNELGSLFALLLRGSDVRAAPTGALEELQSSAALIAERQRVEAEFAQWVAEREAAGEDVPVCAVTLQESPLLGFPIRAVLDTRTMNADIFGSFARGTPNATTCEVDWSVMVSPAGWQQLQDEGMPNVETRLEFSEAGEYMLDGKVVRNAQKIRMLQGCLVESKRTAGVAAMTDLLPVSTRADDFSTQWERTQLLRALAAYMRKPLDWDTARHFLPVFCNLLHGAALGVSRHEVPAASLQMLVRTFVKMGDHQLGNGATIRQVALGMIDDYMASAENRKRPAVSRLGPFLMLFLYSPARLFDRKVSKLVFWQLLHQFKQGQVLNDAYITLRRSEVGIERAVRIFRRARWLAQMADGQSSSGDIPGFQGNAAEMFAGGAFSAEFSLPQGTADLLRFLFSAFDTPDAELTDRAHLPPPSAFERQTAAYASWHAFRARLDAIATGELSGAHARPLAMPADGALHWSAVASVFHRVPGGRRKILRLVEEHLVEVRGSQSLAEVGRVWNGLRRLAMGSDEDFNEASEEERAAQPEAFLANAVQDIACLKEAAEAAAAATEQLMAALADVKPLPETAEDIVPRAWNCFQHMRSHLPRFRASSSLTKATLKLAQWLRNNTLGVEAEAALQVLHQAMPKLRAFWKEEEPSVSMRLAQSLVRTGLLAVEQLEEQRTRGLRRRHTRYRVVLPGTAAGATAGGGGAVAEVDAPPPAPAPVRRRAAPAPVAVAAPVVAAAAAAAAAPEPEPEPAAAPALAVPDEHQSWEVANDDVLWGDILGRGGFGVVHRVEYHGQTVAAKRLAAQGAELEAAGDMLRRELRVLTRVHHPNVVRLLGVGSDPDSVFMLMEFAERGSLQGILQRSPKLPQVLQFRLLRGIALGMLALHQHRDGCVLHRDLKSANVLVSADWTAKVADFGLASAAAGGATTRTRSGGGTLAWKAPELLDDEPFTVKSDVYSFGVVAYEVASGLVPWEGLSEVQVIKAVAFKEQRPPVPDDTPPFFANLVRRCWAQDPAERPDFREVADLFLRADRLFSGSGSGEAAGAGAGGATVGGLEDQVAALSLQVRRATELAAQAEARAEAQRAAIMRSAGAAGAAASEAAAAAGVAAAAATAGADDSDLGVGVAMPAAVAPGVTAGVPVGTAVPSAGGAGLPSAGAAGLPEVSAGDDDL